MTRDDVIALLTAYHPTDGDEFRDRAMMLAFLEQHERFWQRDNDAGHITASAWVVCDEFDYALLTHHRKLNRWLQPGGHIDDDHDLLGAAQREAREETGLVDIAPVADDIFDIDAHLIPASPREPAHYHYDIRFLLRAHRHNQLVISDESHDLRWFPIAELAQAAEEHSIQRMAIKSLRYA